MFLKYSDKFSYYFLFSFKNSFLQYHYNTKLRKSKQIFKKFFDIYVTFL